jgi:hypothetical protein
MSDVSPGSGWWMATDGEWYAPEQHPDYVSPSSLDDGAPGPGWWMASDGKWYAPEQHPREAPPTNGSAPVNGSGGHPTASLDALEKVRRLGGLLEAGRLSVGEFQQMRKEILGL